MTARFCQWTLDVHDVETMATFWSQALGYRTEAGDDGSAKLYPPDDSADAFTVWLQASAAPKRDKNRNHPDLVATDGDDEAEVERLIGLGARRADVGQTGEEQFEVLVDPEDNEFCVLHHPPLRPR